MKNINLIEGLWTDSHEKQRVSGMRRYAAMLLLLLITCAYAYADTELFSTDFSSAAWSSATFNQGNTTTPDVINGITFYSKNSTKQFSISSGELLWPDNNIASSNYFMGIPVSNVNGSITVTVTMVAVSKKSANVKYVVTDGATSVYTPGSTGTQATGTAGEGTVSFTVNLSNANKKAVVYLGRYNGNAENTNIKSISITTPSGSTPTHSVSAVTSTGTNTYGSVSAASTTVAEGGTTTITATPAAGYRVTNWAVSGTGASISPTGASNSNTTTLTMGTANATVTVTFGLIDYAVTKTLTNCAVKDGSTAIPSTMNYGDDLSTIIEPTSGNLLPSSITVSGVTSYTWNALTGALTLTDVTGAVSISISAGSPQTGSGATVTYTMVTSGSTAATYSTGVFTGILSRGSTNKNTIVASNTLSGGNGVGVQDGKTTPNNSRTAGMTSSTSAFSAGSSPYAEFTFDVVDGYTFTPTAISVPVMPITNNAYFTAIVTDGSSTWTSATSECTQGAQATINATPSGGSALTGTVNIRVFCHSQATAAKGFRIGTGSVTITGTVAEDAAPCSDDTGLAYGTGTVNKTYGDASFTNTLTNPNSLSVTYSSTNTSVATVNSSTGAVTIKAAGTTTIKATWAGDATYCEDEVSYTLNVKPNPGDESGTWDRFGGETISLSVSPSGGSSYTYQWQKWYNDQWNNVSNGTADGATTTGATSANLQIENCGPGNSGSYHCVVTSAGQSSETDGIQVKVYVLECYNSGTTVYNFTRDGENQAGSLTIDLAANTNYAFKFHADNDYYGNDGTISTDATNWVCSTSQGNLTIYSGLGGTFTIAMEYSTGGNSSVLGEPEISVTYPRKKIYMACGDWKNDNAKMAVYYWRGEVNDWTDDFMSTYTCDDNVRYTTIPAWAQYLIFGRFNNTKTSTGNWDDIYNQSCNISPSATYDLYTFSGWSDCDGKSSFTNTSSFSETTFTISYNKGTSGTGTKSSETKTCDVAFTLPSSAVFTREGYLQTGWTTSDGGAQTHALGGSYTTNDDQTFYPVWTVQSYNLTWDLAGGTTTSAGTGIASGVSANTTSSVAYGTSLTAPTVTKSYHTFSAWSPTVASTMPAANTTYTATWTANKYSVTITPTNVTKLTGSTGSNAATYGTNYTATFRRDLGYSLPSTITVTISGNSTESGTDYTWNSSTGTLTILGAKITGNIVVSLSGTAVSCPDGSSTETLFSLSSVGSGYSNTSGAETELTNITVSGGFAYGYGEDGKALSYSSNKIKYGGGVNYIKLTLDCALQPRDIISFSCDANNGLNFNSDKDGTAAGAGSYTTGALNGSTYTVVADDGLDGESTIYCWRRTSNSTNVTAITITRPGAYDITKSATNGTISTKVGGSEVTQAVADAKVAIKATPSTGYEFDSWDVYKTGESSTKVDLDDDDDSDGSTRQFDMPAYDVTVAASFTAVDYTLTHSATSNGSYTIKVADGSATGSNTTANYGQTITLTATPSSGYVFDHWTTSGTSVTLGNANVESTTFTMPAGNVTIGAVFKLKPNIYYYKDATHYSAGTYKNPEGETASSGDNNNLTTPWTISQSVTGVTSVSVTNGQYDGKGTYMDAYIKLAKGGDASKQNIIFIIAEGYEATISTKIGGYSSNPSVTLKPYDGESLGSDITKTTGYATVGGVATTENNFNEIRWSDLEAGTYILNVSSQNAYISEIDIQTVLLGYAITNGSPSGGTIAITDGTSPITVAAEDATVYITATPSTGYSFTSWDIYKTGTPATKITPAAATANTSFTMPAYAVTVDATFTAIDYAITHTAASNGTYTIKVGSADAVSTNTTANYGQTITLAASPDSHYALQAWNVTCGGDPVAVTNNQFSMPAGNVTIAPTFGAVYTVTFDSNGGSSVDAIEQSTVGGAITMPDAPTKDDYTFVNWMIGSTTKDAGDSYTPTANVTAYATWKSDDCAGGGGSATTIFKAKMLTSGMSDKDTEIKALNTATSFTTSNYLSELEGGSFTFNISTAGHAKANNDYSIRILNVAAYFTITLSGTEKIQAGDVIKVTVGNQNGYLQIGSGSYSSATDIQLTKGSEYSTIVTNSMVGQSTLYLKAVSNNMDFVSIEILRPSEVLLYMHVKDGLVNGNLPTEETQQTTSNNLAVVSGGTVYAGAATAGHLKIVNTNEIQLNNNSAYFKFVLPDDLAEGDVLYFRSATTQEIAITKTSTRSTDIKTSGYQYTIPEGSGLIGENTIWLWYYSSAVNVKTLAVVRPNGGGSCYYVTYDGNGADGGYTNDPTAYDDENNDVTVLTNGFTRTGYEFVGWKDGSGISHNPGTTITDISADVTLYAQWRVLISSNNTDFSGYTIEDTDDVHITEGATLTVSESTEIHDIIIEPGATLSITSGATLNVNELSLHGGWTSIGGTPTYDMPRVYIDSESTLEKEEDVVNFDIAVDARNYYPIALPFDVDVNDVNYVNSTLATYVTANRASCYGTYFAVKEYDGQNRADNGPDQANNWDLVTSGSTLKAGKGYILSAVTVSGLPDAYPYAVIRFPMTVNNAWTAGGEKGSVTISATTYTKNVVPVEAYSGDAATANKCNAGWNMLGVPYMSCFGTKGGLSGASIIEGRMVISDGTISFVEDGTMYVNVPTHDFSEYLQYDITEEDTHLRPGWCFLVQIEDGESLTFAVSNQEQSSNLPIYAPALRKASMPTFKTGIVLSGAEASDKTTILVSDKYSAAAYEINADLEKMFGNGYTLATYSLSGSTRLAYNAMSKNDAANVIPIGYRAPADGEYTFSINPKYAESAFERVELVDYQEGITTNLLLSSYTFTTARTQNDSRFALNIVPKAETPSGLENGELLNGDASLNGVQKVLYKDHIYIIREGKIYGVDGAVVK